MTETETNEPCIGDVVTFTPPLWDREPDDPINVFALGIVDHPDEGDTIDGVGVSIATDIVTPASVSMLTDLVAVMHERFELAVGDVVVVDGDEACAGTIEKFDPRGVFVDFGLHCGRQIFEANRLSKAGVR